MKKLTIILIFLIFLVSCGTTAEQKKGMTKIAVGMGVGLLTFGFMGGIDDIGDFAVTQGATAGAMIVSDPIVDEIYKEDVEEDK